MARRRQKEINDTDLISEHEDLAYSGRADLRGIDDPLLDDDDDGDEFGGGDIGDGSRRPESRRLAEGFALLGLSGDLD